MKMLGVLALMRLMQVFGQVTYRLLVIYLPTISFDLDVLKGYMNLRLIKELQRRTTETMLGVLSALRLFYYFAICQRIYFCNSTFNFPNVFPYTYRQVLSKHQLRTATTRMSWCRLSILRSRRTTHVKSVSGWQYIEKINT